MVFICILYHVFGLEPEIFYQVFSACGPAGSDEGPF